MFHLVTNEDSKKRLINLGEENRRILNVGFPPLSNIDKKKLYSKDDIKKLLQFSFDKELNIFTYHPVPKEFKQQRIIFKLIEILSKQGHKFILTYPNFDPGYESIIRDQKTKQNRNITIVKNLGQKLYFSILNYIGNNNGFCIGNSSSGIKETMFFNCKVINLGIRQQSRLKSKMFLTVK